MTWQEEAIAALGFIAPAEEWQLDADGDVRLPEGDEEPGWLIWLGGGRMRLDWGCITFESDVQRNYEGTARRLLAAAKAWEMDPAEAAEVAAQLQESAAKVSAATRVELDRLAKEAGVTVAESPAAIGETVANLLR